MIRVKIVLLALPTTSVAFRLLVKVHRTVNMENIGVKSLVLVICILVVSINCTTDEKAVSKLLNGRTLFDIGLKTKTPMLRLIGRTVMELECRYHQCSVWSEWSACELLAGQFGRQKRTRVCGMNTNCGSGTSPRNETDARMCEDFCPHDYEMTPEGVCLKFYNTTQKSQPLSKASCETDGGYLININSPMKWRAFSWLMEKYAYTGGVFIDGQRKNVNSPWVFSYETEISGFTSWAPNEPNNGSYDLCLYGYKGSSDSGISDYPCGNNLVRVCEKLPSI